ncbi:MAG: hypothetical protein V7K50_13635 [Nostoc sp.]|uniref:hypothetical protein n=1 Tax=Nostoc sp. TaxID=1180 RepID=UPI002FF85EB8
MRTFAISAIATETHQEQGQGQKLCYQQGHTQGHNQKYRQRRDAYCQNFAQRKGGKSHE